MVLILTTCFYFPFLRCECCLSGCLSSLLYFPKNSCTFNIHFDTFVLFFHCLKLMLYFIRSMKPFCLQRDGFYIVLLVLLPVSFTLKNKNITICRYLCTRDNASSVIECIGMCLESRQIPWRMWKNMQNAKACLQNLWLWISCIWRTKQRRYWFIYPGIGLKSGSNKQRKV